MEPDLRRPPPVRDNPSSREALRPNLELPSQAPRAQDYWHVNIAEAWEVAFWCREFQCREEDLRRAVRAAGPLARDVRAQLRTEHQQRS